MSTVYERRVEQEWRLLQALIEGNQTILGAAKEKETENGIAFDFDLHHTDSLIKGLHGFQVHTNHKISLHFPKFFPSMPIEARLGQPVFHPNIHPETGFVCLWGKFSPGDTVIEAVAQLQRVVTWHLLNRESEHIMQLVALEWFDDAARSVSLPLRFQPISVPRGLLLQRTYRNPPTNLRRRLS
ncbi:MAG: ubiquitin-conjugating enzyme E2 [Candidatus Sulfotelmatobacter sp.]